MQNKRNTYRRRRYRKKYKPGYYRLLFILILTALFTGLLINVRFSDPADFIAGDKENTITNTGNSNYEAGNASGNTAESPHTPTDDPETEIQETPVRIPPVITIPIPDPRAVDGTRPEEFGLQTSMQLNGEPIDSYSRTNPINFGDTNHYTDIEGIITFRGNNFRDTAAYGSLGPSVEGKLEIVWSTSIPEVFRNPDTGSTWFGMGWTGQPLIVNRRLENRANMNILESKRNKPELKEVIFGTMGASIYFLDLDDGKPTRNRVNERWIFKGAGALDPRGYPLFFVGAGDASPAGPGQNLIYNLLNTRELYNYGEYDRFRDRGWQAFDGSTIVHAPTD